METEVQFSICRRIALVRPERIGDEERLRRAMPNPDSLVRPATEHYECCVVLNSSSPDLCKKLDIYKQGDKQGLLHVAGNVCNRRDMAFPSLPGLAGV